MCVSLRCIHYAVCEWVETAIYLYKYRVTMVSLEFTGTKKLILETLAVVTLFM